MEIKEYEFNVGFKHAFKEDKFINYPIVYILNNHKEVYIGETTNVVARMNAHNKRKERKKLSEVRLILSEEFNQSATYNIETNLINYFIAEGKYKLQNISQTKQKVMHNYKDKAYYDQEMFGEIWNKLIEIGLVTQSLEQIENKDVFKISPFKSLSLEQAEVKADIIEFCKLNVNQGKNAVYVIQGEAGTGKSVLISSLYSTLQDMSKSQSTPLYNSDNYLLVNHGEMLKTYHTMSKVLKNLVKKNIKKPTSYINEVEKSNIAIIDEAHLLLTAKDPFNNYHGENHLKDIIEKNDVTILIYDPKQYLKVSAYWEESSFTKLLKTYAKNEKRVLVDQLRMNANSDSIKWISDFVNKKITDIPKDNNFDLRIFDSPTLMYQEIQTKNKEYGLSRIVSTFDFEHKKDGKDYYVKSQDFKLPWNRTYKQSWAEVTKTINEVGSIYTVQGFDLNYVGVILGPTVKYDREKDELFIDINEYKDKKAFSVPKNFNQKIDIEKVKEQIILNSINILLKRGIKGTYIYAHDQELRERLRQVRKWK